MPRVLLVFEPPDGGVAENVAQLALGAADHGWEVEVAGPRESIVEDRITAAGIPLHRLPIGRGHGRPGHELRALMPLARLLRGGRFSLVHSHASKAGVLGRVAAATARTPSLYSPHCFAFASELPRATRVAAIGAERLLGRIGDVLCVCEDERAVALRAGVSRPERLHVVHNGSPVCPDDVVPEPALAALRARGPVVGAVAALREQKRLDLLIDAAPTVLARVPDAHVAIVGDGPLKAELEQRAAARGLASEPRFAFVPFTPPSARALRALDVYVLPSAWEAFPIGVLEALACGVPQVVTDVGGNGEAVTAETGTLVPPGDATALAEAIVALLEDPARRADCARASRARHATCFNLERMVADTVGVYDAVVRRAARPASEREETAR